MAALLPPGVVTMTLVDPADPAGVTQVMLVALTTLTLVAATPPKVTPVAPVKLVPVSVTLVPPAVLPLFGLTLVSVGGATGLIAPNPLPCNKGRLIPFADSKITLLAALREA